MLESGNDKLAFICDIDYSDKTVPSDWQDAVEKLKKEYATDLCITTLANVFLHEVVILSVRKPKV